MRRILDRYILREVALSWAAVTGVLLALLLTNQLAVVLERAAENQYPRGVVAELIWLGAMQNASIIMPVGLLLGVVLALGRLYHDSEMTAVFACGVGPARLYGPITVLAVLVAAAVGWLTLFVSPQASGKTITLRSEALRAGQFAPVAPGTYYILGWSTTRTEHQLMIWNYRVDLKPGVQNASLSSSDSVTIANWLPWPSQPQ